MKNISSILDGIISELEVCGADLSRMDQEDIEKVKASLNKQPYVLWIDYHEKLIPFYVNDYGKAFYGLKTNNLAQYGFGLYKKIFHPDNFKTLKTRISYFNSNSDIALQRTYLLKLKSGYRWVYSSAKAFSFNDKNTAKYIISLVYDIDDLVGLTLNKNEVFDDPVFVMKHQHQYDMLTKREKEILKLIAEDRSNSQVAKMLEIKESTVKTHRKNILRKLNVNSAIGLVKFALLF